MQARLEKILKPDFDDPEGKGVNKRITEHIDVSVDPYSTRVIDILTFDSEQLTEDILERAKNEIFTNPITHDSSFEPLANDLDWSYAIWVGSKPGVMDPEGLTAVEAIEDRFGIKFADGESIYTSRLYLFSGWSDTMRDVFSKEIATGILSNSLIQRYQIISRKEWNETEGLGIIVPKVILEEKPWDERVVTFPISSPEELKRLSDERSLFLNPNDLSTIIEYFQRPEVIEARTKFGLEEPTDIELEYIAQARSDHCNHNTFNGRFIVSGPSINPILFENLFDECIKKPTLKLKDSKDWIVSVLWDNAGVARFDDENNYTISAETHNSPTTMEAYGGSITGNVGEYRDKMGTGLGSKVFMGFYGFCFGPRDYDGDLKPKLHPRRLWDGAIRGIRDGANKSGVHTPLGLLVIDESYIGKCNLFAGSIGIMPNEINGEPSHEKSIDDGDLCLMLGGKVGMDGIHGVTAASAQFSENIPAGHVQIGYPYGQKKMEGLILEARDKGLINFITDNGGGGLSSSVGETARYCGDNGGVHIDLEKVPLKYEGLDPWQIWISESQERMTLALSPHNLEEFMELSKKHDVESTVIGSYNDSGKIHVEYENKTIMHLDLDLLTAGFPQWEFEAEWIEPKLRLSEPVISNPKDHAKLLEDMLARPNICSREWIVRQYDHEVQGGSVVKPLVGEDNDVHSGAIVSTPVLDSKKGIALTQVINPWFSKIDTYDMTHAVIDEAVRKIISVGGNLEEIGGIDNFCWPDIQYDPETNPDGKYKAAQLVRSCRALKEAQEILEIPLLSGKDSIYIDGLLPGKYGETRKVSGLPTLQFTASNVVKDVEKCITMDAKAELDLVYVLGGTKDELGGSEYYSMFDEVGLNVPKTDLEKNLQLYRALQKATEEEILESAHAVSRGGLGVHLAQVAFAGNLGMSLDLSFVETDLQRDDSILYSESTGRLIVTVSPKYAERFNELMEDQTYECIGVVTGDKIFKVKGIHGDIIIEKPIDDLKAAYKGTFGDLI